MTIELPPLDSEPLIYFLAHSAVFVAILAGLFFLIGLALGHASWGKYKARARALAAETEAQRNEIADLKRKLAEQSLKPLPLLETAPAPAPLPATAVPAVKDPAPSVASHPQEVLKMPELSVGTPLPETPPVPARPAPPRPKPATTVMSTPPRSPRAEPAAIAPFSFLSDEPAAPPPAKG